METLTIRGIEKAVAKKLIRIETVSLTLPFVVFGCAAGVILAAVIAKASSLEPSDTITPYILLILFLYLVSVPVTTEVWLYRMSRKKMMNPSWLVQAVGLRAVSKNRMTHKWIRAQNPGHFSTSV